MRYRVGWPVPGRVLALTHFAPLVTGEDYAGIIAETGAALGGVERPFHMLIDNRRLADPTVTALDEMLLAFPQLAHPRLRWIVQVLPASISQAAPGMAEQRRGAIRLRFAASLEAAFDHLLAVDETLLLDGGERAFFAAAADPA